MKLLKNEKGMSGAIILLVVVIVSGVGVYLATQTDILKKPANDNKKVEYKEPIVKTQTEENTDSLTEETQPTNTFTQIKETKNTPKEIDNTVLNELDEIVTSVDSDIEDMSDL